MTRLTAVAGAALVAAAGLWFVFGQQPQPGNTEVTRLIGAANAQEAAEVDTSSVVEMSMGAPDAPVTMVEYASFTCPHCASFHNDTLKQLKTDYIDTGKVRLVYHDVYFDKYGLWASMVARCGGPEKFFGIASMIYKGQSEWVRADGEAAIVGELKKIGRLAGIDNDQLEACMQDSDKAQTLVAWFQKNAEADNITGTPSFIIDGEMVKNQPYDDLKKILDAKLGE